MRKITEFMKQDVKILFILLLLSTIQVCGQSQIHVDSIVVVPASPSTTDSVQIRVQVTSLDYGDKIYDSLSISGNTFEIFYCIRQSPLTALVTYTDTFNVGTLPAGNYIVITKAYRSVDSNCVIKNDSTEAIRTLVVSQANSVEKSISGEGYSVKLFPNPAKNQQELIIESNFSQNFEILLYNASGQLIQKVYAGPIWSGNKTLMIETSDLSAGVYFYQISTDKSRHNLKTIIK